MALDTIVAGEAMGSDRMKHKRIGTIGYGQMNVDVREKRRDGTNLVLYEEL